MLLILSLCCLWCVGMLSDSWILLLKVRFRTRVWSFIFSFRCSISLIILL